MRQTVTIDIINEKVIRLLQELEQLHLIRLHEVKSNAKAQWPQKYKGAMAKQSILDIDTQLNELRNESTYIFTIYL